MKVYFAISRFARDKPSVSKKVCRTNQPIANLSDPINWTRQLVIVPRTGQQRLSHVSEDSNPSQHRNFQCQVQSQNPTDPVSSTSFTTFHPGPRPRCSFIDDPSHPTHRHPTLAPGHVAPRPEDGSSFDVSFSWFVVYRRDARNSSVAFSDGHKNWTRYPLAASYKNQSNDISLLQGPSC